MKVPILICHKCGWVDDEYNVLAAYVISCKHCDSTQHYTLIYSEKEAKNYLNKNPYQSEKNKKSTF
jgi:hypothetical protein